MAVVFVLATTVVAVSPVSATTSDVSVSLGSGGLIGALAQQGSSSGGQASSTNESVRFLVSLGTGDRASLLENDSDMEAFFGLGTVYGNDRIEVNANQAVSLTIDVQSSIGLSDVGLNSINDDGFGGVISCEANGLAGLGGSSYTCTVFGGTFASSGILSVVTEAYSPLGTARLEYTLHVDVLEVQQVSSSGGNATETCRTIFTGSYGGFLTPKGGWFPSDSLGLSGSPGAGSVWVGPGGWVEVCDTTRTVYVPASVSARPFGSGVSTDAVDLLNMISPGSGNDVDACVAAWNGLGQSGCEIFILGTVSTTNTTTETSIKIVEGLPKIKNPVQVVHAIEILMARNDCENRYFGSNRIQSFVDDYREQASHYLSLGGLYGMALNTLHDVLLWDHKTSIEGLEGRSTAVINGDVGRSVYEAKLDLEDLKSVVGELSDEEFANYPQLRTLGIQSVDDIDRLSANLDKLYDKYSEYIEANPLTQVSAADLDSFFESANGLAAICSFAADVERALDNLDDINDLIDDIEDDLHSVLDNCETLFGCPAFETTSILGTEFEILHDTLTEAPKLMIVIRQENEVSQEELVGRLKKMADAEYVKRVVELERKGVVEIISFRGYLESENGTLVELIEHMAPDLKGLEIVFERDKKSWAGIDARGLDTFSFEGLTNDEYHASWIKPTSKLVLYHKFSRDKLVIFTTNATGMLLVLQHEAFHVRQLDCGRSLFGSTAWLAIPSDDGAKGSYNEWWHRNMEAPVYRFVTESPLFAQTPPAFQKSTKQTGDAYDYLDRGVSTPPGGFLYEIKIEGDGAMVERRVPKKEYGKMFLASC